MRAFSRYSRILSHPTHLSPPLYCFGYTKGAPFLKPITISNGDFFRHMTEKQPSAPVVHSYSQNTTLSYADLLQQAEQLATGLVKTFHLKPKDRIGIYAYNRYEWVVVQMAAALADLILVNINPAYQSDELAYTIDKVGLKVLFLCDKFKQLDYLKIVRQTIPEIEHSHPFDLKSKSFPNMKAVVRMGSTQPVKGFARYQDLIEPQDRSLLSHGVDKDDPANIQFTSGTTGRPKAATLSHYNILNNGLLIGEQCRYTSKDNIALPVPYYHCFGMILGTLGAVTRGASSTIICEGFNPKLTLQAISKYKCTGLYGVPTMFIEHIRNYEADPTAYNIDTLRTGIVAGALCSQALMTKIISVLKMSDITNCYGMTQTSPVSFQTTPDDPFNKKTTTVGRVLPGLEAKIMSSEEKQCGVGEAGEFWVRGWAVMNSYWEDNKATSESITADGWMKSGDLGMMDEDGYLSIVGRKKDMIIRGGENIYPKEIEEFLAKMEGLMDVQVVSIPDQKYGEQVVAVIKVQDVNKNSVTRQDVFRFCKDKIAFYKIPKFVKFVNEYPLTVSGKVQKFIMRQELEREKEGGKLESYKVKTK